MSMFDLDAITEDAENRRDQTVEDLVCEYRRLHAALEVIASRTTPTFTHAGYTIRLDADGYAKAVLEGREGELWDDGNA